MRIFIFQARLLNMRINNNTIIDLKFLCYLTPKICFVINKRVFSKFNCIRSVYLRRNSVFKGLLSI